MPFVVYADFESILECTINVQNSTNVKSVQKHIPFAYSYYIICSYNSDLNIFRIYNNNNNAPQHFFKSLVNEIFDICTGHLSVIKSMNSLTLLQHI